jgi:hypothetical protein
MAITSWSFKIVRWRALGSARILFPYVQTATAKPGASTKADTTSRNFLVALKLKVDEERRYQ